MERGRHEVCFSVRVSCAVRSTDGALQHGEVGPQVRLKVSRLPSWVQRLDSCKACGGRI